MTTTIKNVTVGENKTLVKKVVVGPPAKITIGLPYLDSDFVVSIVDSDYINNLIDTDQFSTIDSAAIISFIDSDYIQARQITYDFLDSAEAFALIDSDYIIPIARSGLSSGTGVLYTEATGVISIGQPVDSEANVVFNSLSINDTTAIDSSRNAYFTTVYFDSSDNGFVARTAAWNDEEDTLDIVTQSGSIIQVGQEVLYKVRNNTASQIDDGTAVMATGTLGNSGRITVAPMDGTDVNNARFFLGITTENIGPGADGKVTHFGKVRGVNLTDYDEGDVLWISTDSVGELTNVEPTSGMKLPIAFVISNKSNGSMMVRATNGLSVRDLNDINFTEVRNQDILSWDSDIQRWINTNTPAVVSISLDSASTLTGITQVVSTAVQTPIKTFSKSLFGSGKFVIQAYDSDAQQRHVTELLVVHDDTTAYATEYGTIYTGSSSLAEFDVDISGSDVRILATNQGSNPIKYSIFQNTLLN